MSPRANKSRIIGQCTRLDGGREGGRGNAQYPFLSSNGCFLIPTNEGRNEGREEVTDWDRRGRSTSRIGSRIATNCRFSKEGKKKKGFRHADKGAPTLARSVIHPGDPPAPAAAVTNVVVHCPFVNKQNPHLSLFLSISRRSEGERADAKSNDLALGCHRASARQAGDVSLTVGREGRCIHVVGR